MSESANLHDGAERTHSSVRCIVFEQETCCAKGWTERSDAALMVGRDGRLQTFVEVAVISIYSGNRTL
jgi:hypothetical protein